METIKIYKKQGTQSTFNVYHYQKFLSELFPNLDPINIKFLAEKTNKLYAKIKEFDTDVDDNTITRNIIKQQDVYCEFSDNLTKNSANIIKSDVIILGKKHNWAKFEDVIVTKFNNYLHNYPREVLDDPKKLLQAQYRTYLAMKFIENAYPKLTKTFVTTPCPRIDPVMDDIVFDSKLLSPVSIFIQRIYKYDLDVKNFYRLYYQLRSAGMLEVLTSKSSKKIVENRINEENANISRIIKTENTLEIMSTYNLMKTIVAKEYDSNSEVNKIISSKKQMTPAEFYKLIPKKDAEKIQKILGDRVKDIYNTCTHVDLVRSFVAGKKYLREQILELCDIDQNTRQYHCSKCSKRAFCQHHLDLSSASPAMKMNLINKYKSPELSNNTMYYCKYCYEKIYKNETEFVLTALDVISMTRVRENNLSQDRNIDIYDNGLYLGITAALSCFKIGYEYSPQMLARSIKYSLYDIVYDQVVKMNIEDDSYLELLTKMHSFIFTLVYLRPLFMKDPKISTKSDTRKQDSAYGKFINDEVTSRFKEISNSEQVLNIIKTAIVRLRDKGVGITKIQAKTDKDNIQEILQSRQFWVLYQMFNYGNPNTDALTVFGRLVKKSKPNLSNFTEGMVMPTKNVTEIAKNIYTHLFDYTSPYCYLYNFSENESLSTITAGTPKYDPKIHDMLMKDYMSTMEYNKVIEYRKLIKLEPNNHFRYGVGANYLYDDEGDMIEWMPMGPKNDWEHKTKSGKTMHLSKIKKHIDNTTAAKVDARNNKIGFTKAEFVARKPEKRKEIVEKPDGSDFEFNKKIIGLVVNLDSKFNQYMISYLGRTEGYDYTTLMKGQLKNVESYSIGQLRVNSYINMLIAEYYSLKNDPLSSDFLESNNLEFSKYQDTIKTLPVLEISKYRSDYENNVGYWMPEKFYYWVLESLLLMTEVIIKFGKIGELFCTQFFKNIFAEDRKISKPDQKKVTMSIIENKLDETEYDEINDSNKKYKALDEIDFEEDEDDINDYD